MKFELKCTEEDGFEVVYKFEESQLGDVINHIKHFIQASGFVLCPCSQTLDDR